MGDRAYGGRMRDGVAGSRRGRGTEGVDRAYAPIRVSVQGFTPTTYGARLVIRHHMQCMRTLLTGRPVGLESRALIVNRASTRSLVKMPNNDKPGQTDPQPGKGKDPQQRPPSRSVETPRSSAKTLR